MIITRPLYYYASNVAEDLSRILSPHLRLKQTVNTVNPYDLTVMISGAPNGNFRENICSEDDLRTRIFGTFVVKFLACLPLQGFSNIYKMV